MVQQGFLFKTSSLQGIAITNIVLYYVDSARKLIMPTSKPILISGAGLGGLLLARSLRNSKIPFLLYERDASVKSRAQGYRIRISKDGLDALREVLSQDQFNTFHAGTATTEGGGGGINSLDAITAEKKTFFEGPKDSKGPGLGSNVLGVSRGFLRQCLLEGMEDVIHWGKQSINYALSESGVTLKFADGATSPEGILLVAADGPHSAITKQLTDGRVRSYDTGARMIHGQSPKKSFEQLGVGIWGIEDETNPNGRLSLITNVRPSQPGENIEYGWVFVGSPGSFSAPNDDFSIVGEAAADLSRTLTSKWHPKFRPIFENQNDAEAAFLKMSTAQPDGIPEWSNNPHVTVMGDAVHCMTPAGGVGANTALKDAAFLGGLLKKNEGWYSGITKDYESDMRIYASENVKMSFERAAERFNITKLE
jgi:2-polyprenyl-6-methoxyphenol hydroxylase-like FAD-dependent oxidoreductase